MTEQIAAKPIALALLALLLGCAAASTRRPGAAIRVLRKAITLDPRDRESHAKLGRLEITMGREGAAIAHFDRAHQLGLFAHSKRFADLLYQRARQRHKLGHSERWRDLVRAQKLQPELGAVIAQPLAEALLEAGLRRWLAGDHDAADKMWRRIPNGKKAVALWVRAVLTEPKKTSQAELAKTIVLVRRVVGEGAARPLRELYRSRGGSALPLLSCPDSRVIEVVRRACAVLIGTLAKESTTTPPQLSQLELRSANSVAPAVVADVVLLSLSQWLWGQRDDWFDAELRAFVLRETHGQAFMAMPAWLKPTVRRLRGSPVSLATDTPLTRSSHERVFVAMELALRGKTEQARSLLFGVNLPLAKVARATIARGARGGADLSAWASEQLRLGVSRFANMAPQFSPMAERLLANTKLDVSEYPESDKALGMFPRKRVASRPGCADGKDGQWFGAQVAYFTVVETGAQVAEDFIADEPSRFCRGDDVVDFYIRQGDFARAQRVAQTLLLEDATARHGLLVALRAFALGGNVPRAKQILQDAEYWSGQRGGPSLFAAKTFLRAKKPVAALAAARAALALADGVTRWDAFELIVAAALLLDRDRDAKRAFTAYLVDLPKRLRGDAARRVVLRLARHGLARPSWIAPIKPAAGLLSARRAAALSPWAVGPRIELVATAEKKTRLALELLLIGVCKGGERAARALEAFARVADAQGQHALARGARKEAALVR